MVKEFFVYFFIYLLAIQIFPQSQQDTEVLYNAAIEKYIKNDYEKAVEYMEKLYLVSPQEKYKNFLVKILYEAANKSYLAHEYKKAYDYTTKALKYTQDNEKINQLHNILSDILEKEKLHTEKKQETAKKTQQEISQPQTVKKQKLISPPKPQQKMEEEPQAQITVYYEDKKFKILFYITLTILIFVSVIYTITQIKLSHKIKNQLQKQIFELQKENSDLKIQLFETKTELEKTKEREQMYKKYLEEYKKDTQENLQIITQLQNQISNLSKEKTPKVETPTPKVNPVSQVSFQQQELEKFIKTQPSTAAESEYELETYREKLANMYKVLYEINPQKALSIINEMVNSQNSFVRMNIVAALAEIATNETVYFLMKLYNDSDIKVKREVLRQLAELKQKIQNNEVYLSEELKEKIITIVKQEKLKGEWLF